MTTLTDVTSKKKPDPSAEESAARELVRLAREQGLSLTGPDGLLKQFTRSVLETALNEEMTEHLGHEKHRAPEERDSSKYPQRDPAEDGADRGDRAGRDRGAAGP
jgi:putative transposase